MSAGKNIAMGCGVILLAMVVAGWLGFRWVQKNFRITWEKDKLIAWAEEMIGTAPPPQFEPNLGFAGQDQREAVLIFVQPLERGSEVSLTMMSRPGQYDFDTIFLDIDTNNEGVYIRFESTVGEGEDYFANWRDVQVPVRLEEGYQADELLSRQITAIIPVLDHSVSLFFQGDPEFLDRNIVQEMLDRIPADWQPLPQPAVADGE